MPTDMQKQYPSPLKVFHKLLLIMAANLNIISAIFGYDLEIFIGYDVIS